MRRCEAAAPGLRFRAVPASPFSTLRCLSAACFLSLGCVTSAPPEPEPAPGFDAAESGAVQTFLALADAREDRGQLEAALEAVERALETQPRSRRAAVRRAELEARLGQAQGDSGRSERARALLEAMPDQESAAWQHAQARIAMAEGRNRDAIEILSAAIESNPDPPRLRTSLAQALRAEGDARSALDAIDEELARNPGSSAARTERAALYLELGRPDRAVPEARLALRGRDDPELWLTLAQGLRQRRHYSEAQRAVETIAEDERSAAVWAELGWLGLARERDEDAVAALERAESLAPYEPAVLELRLALAQRAEQVQPAVDRIEEALAIQPEDPELLGIYATALDAAGRPQEAADALREAFERSPESTRLLGRLRKHVRDADSPEPAAERIASIGAVSGGAHSMAAGLFPIDDPRALAYLERAVELDPDQPLFRNDLAYRLLETGGDLDRALTLARGAHGEMPSSWAVADTLAGVLMARGDAAEAVAVLGPTLVGAPERDRGVAESRYRYARALVTVGDTEEALRQVLRALRVADSTDERPAWVDGARALRDQLER